jgi:hypothetical protein
MSEPERLHLPKEVGIKRDPCQVVRQNRIDAAPRAQRRLARPQLISINDRSGRPVYPFIDLGRRKHRKTMKTATLSASDHRGSVIRGISMDTFLV